jgi:hypothetical protein
MSTTTNPSGLTDEDELAMLKMLQAQPDFECLPLPAYWYKKYNIPPRAATGPKEYIESNYAMRRALEPKDLPPLIIDEPQQGGKLAKVHPPDATEIKVVSRPFNWDQTKPFPAVICPTETEVQEIPSAAPEPSAVASQA